MINVLVVGSDLTSNGGIASVVKAHYEASKRAGSRARLQLLKTNYYHDRGKIAELTIVTFALCKFLFLVSTKPIDIVHIHSSAHLSFYRKSLFFALAKLFGKKTIIHLHASDFYRFFASSNLVKRQVLDKADKVIVLCNDWKSTLERNFPKANVVTLENPFTTRAHFQPKGTLMAPSPGRKLKVLFVGFLIESKGVLDLLEIISSLRYRDDFRFEFVLAGKGELSKFCVEYARDHDLSSMFRFVGWADEDLKHRLMNECDVFILPSYKEGMPISILEAMSYGLPIISTNIAGIPDLVTPGVNGFLAPPGSVAGFLSGLEEITSNPLTYSQMSNQCVERAKRNTPQNIFNQIEEIYLDIID